MKKEKKRMKPMAFIRKYGRIIIGGIIILAVLFCAVFAGQLTDQDPGLVKIAEAKQTPSDTHPLGTDIYGRDMWARIVFGSRTTLIISFAATTVSTILGTVLGLLCGYYNKVEKIVMRILDAFATIPSLLLCMLMITILGAGIPNLIIAMSIDSVPGLARMIRNQVLSLREKEYIESEKAMGARDIRTLFVHILPACSSYLLVRFSSELSANILGMVSLSYLGVGLDPTVPSWGGMVQEGQRVVFAVPHLVLYPALAICITVFGFCMMSDGLRDLLDPKLR